LHIKPLGCGSSEVYASGPACEEEEEEAEEEEEEEEEEECKVPVIIVRF